MPATPQNTTNPAPDSDASLLTAWARHRCEDSFQRLVEKHSGLVFHTARRVLQDAALAEDIAQQVFLQLAREAPKLDASRGLSGWLHRTTTFAAMNARRSERRRNDRLLRLAEEPPHDPDPVWQDIMPLVDEGMDSLRDTDRQIVLLHYHEGLAFRDVAARLGMSAEAAQKRSVRAVEKLTRWLQRRGATVSSTALGLALAVHLAESAPAGMPAALARHSIALASGNGAATAVTSFLPTMAFAKITTAAAAAALLLPIGWKWQENARAAPAVNPKEAPLQSNTSNTTPATRQRPADPRTAAAPADSLSPRLAALATAIAQIKSPDDPIGFLKVKRLILELPAGELHGALNLVRTVQRPALSLSLSESVFTRWGETAPLEGLAVARDPAFRKWRNTRSQEAGISHSSTLGLFQSWALHDTTAALAAAQAYDSNFTSPDDRQTAEVPSLLAQIAAVRPLDAMNRVLTLPAGPIRDLAETLVRQAWTQSDPAAALRWAIDNTPPDHQADAVGKIMNQMAGTNPHAAVKLAQTLENPHARRDAAQFAIMQIAPHNPQAAVDSLLSLPQDLQTPDLLRHSALFITAGDPHIAADAANRIPEGPQRDAYTEHVARGWWEQDPETCREWLSTSPNVSAAIRTRVLADFDRINAENPSSTR